MLSYTCLGLWALLVAPTVLAVKAQWYPESSVLARLDSLERLVSNLQAQRQHDRLQWQKEKEILMEKIQDLAAAGGGSEQEARTSEHHPDARQATNTVLSPDAVDLNLAQPMEESSHSLHVQSARSDDSGPLEVVVDQLTQKVTQLSADMQVLKASDATRGSTFIHWGRSACTSPSVRVYSGVLGGSMYNHAGAASTALCLSMDPEFQDGQTGVSYTLLYGGEYETGGSHQDRVPVCTMCRSSLSTTFMLPGTASCPSGWVKQYSGFLMAGYYGHAGASQFICVDSKLESLPGNSVNSNGHLLYYTKTQCGSLPCPQYQNDKVVTCVVCSK